MQTIKLSKTEDKRIKWVLQARSKDNARPVLKAVHIEKVNDQLVMVCSDGFRLHVIELESEYKTGLYKVLTHSNKVLVLEPEPGLFPNVWDIFKGHILNSDVVDTDNNNLTCVNPAYLKSACDMPAERIKIVSNDNKPMAFSGEQDGIKMYGLIMPMLK